MRYLPLLFLLMGCAHNRFQNEIIVLDSGLHDSSLFKDRIKASIDLSGHDSTDDLDDHGTSVAGIIALKSSAKIIVMKGVSESSITPIKDFGLSQAIDYAIKNNIKIINCSFRYSEDFEETRTALKRAKQNGILIIAGAGNEGVDLTLYRILYNVKAMTDLYQSFPCQYNRDFDNVICVGNYIETSDGKLDFMGNFGTDSIDIWARGNTFGIPLIDGSLGFKMGVSFAIPKVSAKIAQIWNENPLLKYQEIKVIFQNSLEENSVLKSRGKSGLFLRSPLLDI